MMFLTLILLLIQTEQPLTLIVESSADLFGRAVSMTARADQRIIVADQNDNSVKIVDNNNTIQQSIGGKGWGTESFDMPGDVSTSFLLDLFVSDNNNRRIQRYDKQMQFIHGYTESTMNDAGSIQPVASAVALSGEIFILDADGKRVLQLNPRSIVEKEFGNYTTSAHKISEPKDIAVSDDNEVVVLDANRVLVFDIFGNFIRHIELPGSQDWKSISVSGQWMLITAPDRILLMHRQTAAEHTILPSTFIGARIQEPFSDALILHDRLILLTTTTLYRCALTMP
jgi:hypothetical protein